MQSDPANNVLPGPFLGSSLQAHILMDVSPHENTAPLLLPDQHKLILQ